MIQQNPLIQHGSLERASTIAKDKSSLGQQTQITSNRSNTVSQDRVVSLQKNQFTAPIQNIAHQRQQPTNLNLIHPSATLSQDSKFYTADRCLTTTAAAQQQKLALEAATLSLNSVKNQVPSGMMGRPIPWEAILKQSKQQPMKLIEEPAKQRRIVSQKTTNMNQSSQFQFQTGKGTGQVGNVQAGAAVYVSTNFSVNQISLPHQAVASNTEQMTNFPTSSKSQKSVKSTKSQKQKMYGAAILKTTTSQQKQHQNQKHSPSIGRDGLRGGVEKQASNLKQPPTKQKKQSDSQQKAIVNTSQERQLKVQFNLAAANSTPLQGPEIHLSKSPSNKQRNLSPAAIQLQQLLPVNKNETDSKFLLQKKAPQLVAGNTQIITPKYLKFKQQIRVTPTTATEKSKLVPATTKSSQPTENNRSSEAVSAGRQYYSQTNVSQKLKTSQLNLKQSVKQQNDLKGSRQSMQPILNSISEQNSTVNVATKSLVQKQKSTSVKVSAQNNRGLPQQKKVQSSKGGVVQQAAVRGRHRGAHQQKEQTTNLIMSSSGSLDKVKASSFRVRGASEISPNNFSSQDGKSTTGINKSFQFGHHTQLISCSSGNDSSNNQIQQKNRSNSSKNGPKIKINRQNMGITMQDVIQMKIQPVTTTSAMIQNELDNSYNDQLRLKDILMPATTTDQNQGKKKFSFNIKDDREEKLNTKSQKSDKYNKHASLISFKNHKIDVSHESNKQNKLSSGKKIKTPITPSKVHTASSAVRDQNSPSTKKVNFNLEDVKQQSKEQSKERETSAQQQKFSKQKSNHVFVVQSTVSAGKTGKNKLSLKVNIPSKQNPKNKDKQMFYIPDTSQSDELNITSKSQKKSSSNIERVRVQETSQFNKMVIELRQKQSEIVQLMKKLQQKDKSPTYPKQRDYEKSQERINETLKNLELKLENFAQISLQHQEFIALIPTLSQQNPSAPPTTLENTNEDKYYTPKSFSRAENNCLALIQHLAQFERSARNLLYSGQQQNQITANARNIDTFEGKNSLITIDEYLHTSRQASGTQRGSEVPQTLTRQSKYSIDGPGGTSDDLSIASLSMIMTDPNGLSGRIENLNDNSRDEDSVIDVSDSDGLITLADVILLDVSHQDSRYVMGRQNNEQIMMMPNKVLDRDNIGIFSYASSKQDVENRNSQRGKGKPQNENILTDGSSIDCIDMPEETIFGVFKNNDQQMIQQNSLVETRVADDRLSKTQKITIPKDIDVVDALKTYKQLSFKDDFYQLPEVHQSLALNQTYLSANEALGSQEKQVLDNNYNTRHDFQSLEAIRQESGGSHQIIKKTVKNQLKIKKSSLHMGQPNSDLSALQLLVKKGYQLPLKSSLTVARDSNSNKDSANNMQFNYYSANNVTDLINDESCDISGILHVSDTQSSNATAGGATNKTLGISLPQRIDNYMANNTSNPSTMFQIGFAESVSPFHNKKIRIQRSLKRDQQFFGKGAGGDLVVARTSDGAAGQVSKAVVMGKQHKFKTVLNVFNSQDDSNSAAV